MKFALISDIHGNIEALEAVVNDARAQGLERFLCLGDVAGYGPNPAECVDLVQSLHCSAIRRNHEQFVATSTDVVLGLKFEAGPYDPELLTAMMANFFIAHADLINPEIFSIHFPKKKPREFALTGAL